MSSVSQSFGDGQENGRRLRQHFPWRRQYYLASNRDHGHVCVTDERDGQVVGYAYYARAAMTGRTWHLYWIAVTRASASQLAHYEPTRRFYLPHHYEVTGTLRDYYSDGDDMVVFRKRPAPSP